MKLPTINPLQQTNATKGSIGVLLNALFWMATAWGLDITDEQAAATMAFLNALYMVYVLATRDMSPLRANQNLTYTVDTGASPGGTVDPPSYEARDLP